MRCEKMTKTKEKQYHLGVLLYGCGHHQAAWLMPDSSVERIGDISYYQSLAQLAEKGYFDAVFFADNQSFPAKEDRKSTRLNSSHVAISYAVFCFKKKNITRAE